MYSAIILRLCPTVSTEYPLHQKFLLPYLYFRLVCQSKIIRLLLHQLLQHRFPDIVDAASIHPAVSLVPAAAEMLVPVRYIQRELCTAVGAVEQSRKDTGRSRFGGAALVCPQKLHLVPNRSVDDWFVRVLYDDTSLFGGWHPLLALEAESQRFQSLCHADIGGVVEDSAHR